MKPEPFNEIGDRAQIGGATGGGVELREASAGLSRAEARELTGWVTYCGTPPARRSWSGSVLVRSLVSGRLAVLWLRPILTGRRASVFADATVLTEAEYREHFAADPFALLAQAGLALNPSTEWEALLDPGASPIHPADLLEHLLLRGQDPLCLSSQADAGPLLRALWPAIPVSQRANLRFSTWDFRRADERAPLAFVPPENADSREGEFEGPKAGRSPSGRLRERLRAALESHPGPEGARQHAEGYLCAGEDYLDLLEALENFEALGRTPQALPSLLASRLTLSCERSGLPQPELLFTSVLAEHPTLEGLESGLAALDHDADLELVGGFLGSVLERQSLGVEPSLHLLRALLAGAGLAPRGPAARRTVGRALRRDPARTLAPLLAVFAEIDLLPRPWLLPVYELALQSELPAAEEFLRRPAALAETLFRALEREGATSAANQLPELIRRAPRFAGASLARRYEAKKLSFDSAHALFLSLEEASEVPLAEFAESLAASAPDLARALVRRACDQPWQFLSRLAHADPACEELLDLSGHLPTRRRRPWILSWWSRPTAESGSR